MALESTTPRSRRALLAAGLGGLAATIAGALGRPAPARAGTDGDVVLEGYNQSFDVTEIDVQGNFQGLHVYSSTQAAVVGEASLSGVGVAGSSSSYAGVQAQSNSSYGLQALSNTGIAAYGNSSSTTNPAIFGFSEGNATAIEGYSGNTGDTPPAAIANTGVYGYAAQDTSARGVIGKTTVGQGVRGQATTGVGVYATAGAAGIALQASGRVKLSRSGQASVAAGATYVDVAVTGGLLGTPLPFATLNRFHPGVYVAAIRPNYPVAGVMRIYLSQSASATSATPLSWVVLG